MKKLVVAVALLAIVAGAASAFTFEVGDNLAKMADWGAFVDPETKTPLPVAPPSVGLWDITIASITDIYQPDVAIPGNKYYSGTNPELVALFYGLEVSNVTAVIAPGTRFAGDPGAFSIELSSNGEQTSDGSPYTGGRVDIWEDATTSLNPDGSGGNVNDWAFSTPSGAGWWTDPFGAGEYDTFPTASDGTPILSGTLMDPDGAGPLPILTFYLDYAFGTGFNLGFGYIDIVYNPTGVLFDPQLLPSGATYDISFFNNFTFYPNGSFNGAYEPRVDDPTTDTVYWNSESQDPLRFSVIPEPATLTLLGSGLVGLFGIIRRRRSI